MVAVPRYCRWENGRGDLATKPGAAIRGHDGLGQAWCRSSHRANCLRPSTPGALSGNASAHSSKELSRSCLPSGRSARPPSIPRRFVRSNPKLEGRPTRPSSKVPFDVDHWRKVAEESGPLPEPWSDDPTQWLFKGRPEVSTAPLQVAVARLVGYRWPEQAEADDLERSLMPTGSCACRRWPAKHLPRIGSSRCWPPRSARRGRRRGSRNCSAAGSKKKNLADWLRDEFFKQHCALFGNRPFVWHIWDGQRDGFSALVNYHRLDRKMLEKLTYTYLGQDWVERQHAEVRDEVAGAEARLSAALGLQPSWRRSSRARRPTTSTCAGRRRTSSRSGGSPT